MADTKKYYHNLDVDNNKVINPLLNPLTTVQRTAVGTLLGPLDEGYVCFDTTLNQQYFWDGTTWITTGGGSAVWGSITGTLTAQTDLTAYLASNYYPLLTNPAGYITSSALAPYLTSATAATTYVPYTGATGNVNLGGNDIYASNFNVQPTGYGLLASLTRNLAGSGYGALVLRNGAFGTIQPTTLSVDQTYTLPNATGTIALTSDITPITPAALTKVDDTNVTLTLGGSPSAALLAATSLTLGWTGTLADSRITSASTWNAKQNAISLTTTGTSGAATFIANTLNIPQYQSVLTNPVTGTGVATRVAFWDTGSSISSDADLYWDNTLKRLGIGTASPAYKLDVNSSGRIGNATSDKFYISNYFQFDYGNNGDGISESRIYSNDRIHLQSNATSGIRTLIGTIGTNAFTDVVEAQVAIGDFSVTTGTKTGLKLTGQLLIPSGSTTVNYADISPVFNMVGSTYSGTVRGIYYNPTVGSGSITPPTHIAWENTSGDIIHGNLATGGADEMVTVDSVGKLKKQTIPSGGSGLLHGTASGTDTYTVTIAGATAYADGDAYLIRFPNGNTTGATLNISGFGAAVLYRNNDGPVIGGDIWNGAEMLCIYNSTTGGFQLIGTSPNAMYAYVTNDDSVTITKGQVVYAFGGTGDRMTVKLANNTGDATSAQTVGVVLSTSIAANQKGVIITQGLLTGLSILPTSTYNDGDPLFLGPTAGSVTNVKPYAPNHLVYLGNVTTASNGSAGRWYVRVQNGYELDELHNVQARTSALKDTLWYDNTVSPAQWKTASLSTILGYTPQAQLNGTGFVKATGTTISYDNSTYLTSVGTGTTNEITYWSGTNTIASLSTATYPSLTELSYVKGVTSAIQTQLNSKGYTLGLTSIAGNLVSGTTYYFGNVGRAIIATADVSRVYIPKTGVIKKAYITQYSATTGTITSITLNIRLNNTTDTLVATSTANATFRAYNNNALSINVTEGDYIEIKVTSVSSVAPTANVFGGTIYIE